MASKAEYVDQAITGTIDQLTTRIDLSEPVKDQAGAAEPTRIPRQCFQSPENAGVLRGRDGDALDLIKDRADRLPIALEHPLEG